MSTAPTHLHPLLNQLRLIAGERSLTQRSIAESLGVSERTVSDWFNDDEIVPQKRYRKALAAWLEEQAA